MANIRDIAKATGYSVSTVSRVLNNYPYVDEAKRKRVLQVIKELNYVPNHVARNLSYGKTNNIGVIIPYTNHPYFDQLLSGITEMAFEHHYKVTLLPTNYDAKIEQAYLEEFAAKSFDGLIITSRSNSLPHLLSFKKYGSLVFCEKLPHRQGPCVYIDREHALAEGIRYLQDQGVQHLGVTLGRHSRISYTSKVTIEAVQRFYPNFDVEQDIYWNCLDPIMGYDAGQYFYKHGFDGILTNTDLVAAGVLKAYPTQKHPKIVGRDNLIVSDLLQIPTIDNHLKQCGEQAFELFYQEKSDQIRIPYKFILR
ncbi:LacI family DNA-binding transcriptional regulator [Agrilactobacillus fermenti]|uniref:LacI family DNA-binding transcriptional regulator n=1 Tax=Agrilactobacillus fermenti TaxID=2586909 RepID=UPI001E47C5B1|nr:LacI family DNA-binding transcriptional regulator [Agrilactobacillus fermenti]MCD2257048.1 LacI family DNA-binding transcriptional regulator [Agrilactobacillus fermenti]